MMARLPLAGCPGWLLAGLSALLLASGCVPARQGHDMAAEDPVLVEEGRSLDAGGQAEDDSGPETGTAGAEDESPAPADSVPGDHEADSVEAVPEPEAPILARQRQDCAAQGGQLQPRGAGLFVCARNTRDSGQRCSANAECEGLCLARSETCAPFTPLFGCHEVLLAPGVRVTQCLD